MGHGADSREGDSGDGVGTTDESIDLSAVSINPGFSFAGCLGRSGV